MTQFPALMTQYPALLLIPPSQKRRNYLCQVALTPNGSDTKWLSHQMALTPNGSNKAGYKPIPKG